MNLKVATLIAMTVTTELMEHMLELLVILDKMSKKEQEKNEMDILYSGLENEDVFPHSEFVCPHNEFYQGGNEKRTALSKKEMFVETFLLLNIASLEMLLQ